MTRRTGRFVTPVLVFVSLLLGSPLTLQFNQLELISLTAASMMVNGHKTPDEYALAFTSHPEPDLLKTHDPEKFGCSPCHQGNGRATTSVEKAHGNYEHWLWPMFKPANVEAGCQTCHQADMFLQSGSVGHVISDGKFLFRQRGCVDHWSISSSTSFSVSPKPSMMPDLAEIPASETCLITARLLA